MLDDKENIIQYFSSVKEAGKWCIKNNLTSSTYASSQVGDACRLNKKSLNKKAYGYYWQYTQ